MNKPSPFMSTPIERMFCLTLWVAAVLTLTNLYLINFTPTTRTVKHSEVSTQAQQVVRTDTSWIADTVGHAPATTSFSGSSGSGSVILLGGYGGTTSGNGGTVTLSTGTGSPR